MNILASLALLFSAHATPVATDCVAYQGNWVGAPAHKCEVISGHGGGIVKIKPKA